MNILYLGDIMGEVGIEVVEAALPKLVEQYTVDLVVAQSENVSDGKSMLPVDMVRLQAAGVGFFTGGNHTPSRKELHGLLEDADSPVIGPANMKYCPGTGWKYINTNRGKVLVVSLLGSTVGRSVESTSPFAAIDAILDENRLVEKIATIVNFHGDFSSEKKVIGYYLDGKVTAVIGDHWHVPTADAMILPKGTGHISDVGMCGILHSSLGVKTSTILSRWRDGKVNVNVLETEGPRQLNAVLFGVDVASGLATEITQIQQILD